MRRFKKIKTGYILVLIGSLLLIAPKIAAQVGVNIVNPHSSAAMQIEAPTGTAKGLLTPSMTTTQRMSMSIGTVTPADGLIVYDKDHRMHYYYQAGSGKWVSMSPLTLSSPTTGATSFPSGFITTPSSTAVFSVGINKQNPTQALDVVGNTAFTGSASVGGNTNIGGSASISGNNAIGGNVSVGGSLALSGSLSVTGFANNALVPSGVIVMWSGTVIPGGWGLCDGGTYNGLTTPDLRGRFIVGVQNTPSVQSIPTGQYLVFGISGLTPAVAPNDGATQNYGTIGNTGGQIGHILTTSEIPSHAHNFTDQSPSTVSGSVYMTVNGGTSVDLKIDPVPTSTSNTGGNGVHENRPPYYVLAYIIKLP